MAEHLHAGNIYPTTYSSINFTYRKRDSPFDGDSSCNKEMERSELSLGYLLLWNGQEKLSDLLG